MHALVEGLAESQDACSGGQVLPPTQCETRCEPLSSLLSSGFDDVGLGVCVCVCARILSAYPLECTYIHIYVHVCTYTHVCLCVYMFENTFSPLDIVNSRIL